MLFVGWPIAGNSLVECSQILLNMVTSGESQELATGYEDRDNEYR